MNYNVLYASQFLMQHSGTIRIWHTQRENKDPSCQHCRGDFLGTLICNPVIVKFLNLLALISRHTCLCDAVYGSFTC